MAASKKPAKSKGRAKFKDLKTKKSVKGGAQVDFFDKASPVLYSKKI
jgi:hypothetical protein